MLPPGFEKSCSRNAGSEFVLCATARKGASFPTSCSRLRFVANQEHLCIGVVWHPAVRMCDEAIDRGHEPRGTVMVVTLPTAVELVAASSAAPTDPAHLWSTYRAAQTDKLPHSPSSCTGCEPAEPGAAGGLVQPILEAPIDYLQHSRVLLAEDNKVSRCTPVHCSRPYRTN